MKNRKQEQNKQTLTLNDQDLTELVSDRNLGAFISNDQKWNTQCESPAPKANTILGMLKRKYSYWTLSSLKALNTAIIRLFLEIFSSVWRTYRKKETCKLESVQKATKTVPSALKLN